MGPSLTNCFYPSLQVWQEGHAKECQLTRAQEEVLLCSGNHPVDSISPEIKLGPDLAGLYQDLKNLVLCLNVGPPKRDRAHLLLLLTVIL